VGRLQYNGTGHPNIDGALPGTSTNTPLVPRDEAGEVVLGSWGNQVVASRSGEFEKLCCHEAAHSMEGSIRAVGIATSISEPSGHWRHRAAFKLSTEDVVGGEHGNRLGILLLKWCISQSHILDVDNTRFCIKKINSTLKGAFPAEIHARDE